MTKKIKVVETRTYFYVPDMTGESYTEPDGDREPATTIEAAMEIDKADIENELCDLDELVQESEDYDAIKVERTWEIVDVNE